MLFPVLDFKERLQVGDKTRFDASKCFATKDENTFLTAVVTPGADGDEQDIYDVTTQENWFLDWIFSEWTFDIVTGINDKIDFDQGGAKSCALDEDTYTLADLIVEIASKLNATAGIAGTFGVTVDYKNRITITNDSSSFQLLPVTGVNRDAGLLQHIGFTKDVDGSSNMGAPVEYAIKEVVLAINNGGTEQAIAKYVKLYSVNGDCLFSSDQDLLVWESGIMKYVEAGRSSFIADHREAQRQILYYLDKNGYVNVYNEKYTKFDIVDHSEVNEWSTFKTLEIIMWNISNKTDDVFLKRHFEYKKKAEDARNRAVLRLDVDRDGRVDVGEQVDVAFGQVVTR